MEPGIEAPPPQGSVRAQRAVGEGPAQHWWLDWSQCGATGMGAHRDGSRLSNGTGNPLLSPDTPSQRVQFILGTEEDEQHVPHDLFTELDEICVKEGEDAEWKETAR